jgi:hypothetical protein
MPAEHGITVFPRWSSGDTEQLATRLREKYDAAVVPGRWFETPEHFRVGLGLPPDLFEEGLNRLRQALVDLK